MCTQMKQNCSHTQIWYSGQVQHEHCLRWFYGTSVRSIVLSALTNYGCSEWSLFQTQQRCDLAVPKKFWALQTEALSCFFPAWSSLLYAAPLLSRERRGVWRCRPGLALDLRFLFSFAIEKPTAKRLLKELPSKRPEWAETLRNLELRQNSHTLA